MHVPVSVQTCVSVFVYASVFTYVRAYVYVRCRIKVAKGFQLKSGLFKACGQDFGAEKARLTDDSGSEN